MPGVSAGNTPGGDIGELGGNLWSNGGLWGPDPIVLRLVHPTAPACAGPSASDARPAGTSPAPPRTAHFCVLAEGVPPAAAEALAAAVRAREPETFWREAALEPAPTAGESSAAGALPDALRPAPVAAPDAGVTAALDGKAGAAEDPVVWLASDRCRPLSAAVDRWLGAGASEPPKPGAAAAAAFEPPAVATSDAAAASGLGDAESAAVPSQEISLSPAEPAAAAAAAPPPAVAESGPGKRAAEPPAAQPKKKKKKRPVF